MTVTIKMCVECELNEPKSRGLCHTCYSFAQRHGLLGDYPTKPFMDDPENYIRWAFSYFPELVQDVAVEFGKRVA